MKDSWRVDRRDEGSIDLALYVRDALALSDDVQPVVPNLTPSVAVTVPAGVDRNTVVEEWPGWWADLLQWCRDQGEHDPSEPVDDIAPALDGRPALRVALEVFKEPAARHRTAANRARARPTSNVTRVVKELEQELGREAKPFHLVITEVSVNEPMWAPLTPTHVLASVGFTDTEAARPVLRKTLLPLA
ncbi:hypothetical protein [Actinophytocola sp.]|uniref:hypothetical protein n=1 Tax=Actinophytocola sp. TaxID=1872138 RepID=UPI002ED04428